MGILEPLRPLLILEPLRYEYFLYNILLSFKKAEWVYINSQVSFCQDQNFAIFCLLAVDAVLWTICPCPQLVVKECPQPMVLLSDGNSEKSAHGWSKIDNSICLRHKTKSTVVANLIVYK